MNTMSQLRLLLLLVMTSSISSNAITKLANNKRNNNDTISKFSAAGAQDCPCIPHNPWNTNNNNNDDDVIFKPLLINNEKCWGVVFDNDVSKVQCIPENYGTDLCRNWASYYNNDDVMQESSSWCFVDIQQCYRPYSLSRITHVVSDLDTFLHLQQQQQQSDGDIISTPLQNVTSVALYRSFETCGNVDEGKEFYYRQFLQRQHIRVTFPVDSSDGYNLVTKFDGSKGGAMYDFFSALKNEYGFSYTAQNVTELSLSKFKSSYTACVHDVALNETDMCVGPFWGTSERQILAALTASIYTDLFYLVSPKDKNDTFSSLVRTPFKAFQASAWAAIFGSIFLMSWTIAEIHNREKGGQRLTLKRFVRRMCNVAYTAITSFSVGEVTSLSAKPKLAEKIVAAGFMVFALIVLAAYTAASAAYLLANRRIGIYETVEDVVAVPGGKVCIEEVLLPIFSNMYGQLSNKLVPKLNPDELMRGMLNGECVVSVMKFGAIEKIMSDPLTVNCDVIKVGEVLFSAGNVFPVAKHLAEAFSYIVGKSINMGDFMLYQDKNKRSFVGPSLCDVAEQDKDDFQELSIWELLFPIFVTTSCSCIGLLILYLPDIQSKYIKIHRKKKNLSLGISQSSRFDIEKSIKRLDMLEDDSEKDNALRDKIKLMTIEKLFIKLEESEVDPYIIEKASEMLPNRKMLENILFGELCSQSEKDTQLLYQLKVYDLVKVCRILTINPSTNLDVDDIIDGSISTQDMRERLVKEITADPIAFGLASDMVRELLYEQELVEETNQEGKNYTTAFIDSPRHSPRRQRRCLSDEPTESQCERQVLDLINPKLLARQKSVAFTLNSKGKDNLSLAVARNEVEAACTSADQVQKVEKGITNKSSTATSSLNVDNELLSNMHAPLSRTNIDTRKLRNPRVLVESSDDSRLSKSSPNLLASEKSDKSFQVNSKSKDNLSEPVARNEVEAACIPADQMQKVEKDIIYKSSTTSINFSSNLNIDNESFSNVHPPLSRITVDTTKLQNPRVLVQSSDDDSRLDKQSDDLRLMLRNHEPLQKIKTKLYRKETESMTINNIDSRKILSDAAAESQILSKHHKQLRDVNRELLDDCTTDTTKNRTTSRQSSSLETARTENTSKSTASSYQLQDGGTAFDNDERKALIKSKQLQLKPQQHNMSKRNVETIITSGESHYINSIGIDSKRSSSGTTTATEIISEAEEVMPAEENPICVHDNEIYSNRQIEEEEEDCYENFVESSSNEIIFAYGDFIVLGQYFKHIFSNKYPKSISSVRCGFVTLNNSNSYDLIEAVSIELTDPPERYLQLIMTSFLSKLQQQQQQSKDHHHAYILATDKYQLELAQSVVNTTSAAPPLSSSISSRCQICKVDALVHFHEAHQGIQARLSDNGYCNDTAAAATDEFYEVVS